MSRTPEEQKTLDATAAALAAGEDPFGDDEELVRVGADGKVPGETDATETPATGTETDTEAGTGTEGDAGATKEGEGGEPGAAKGEGENGGAVAANEEQQPGAGAAEELDAQVLADIAQPRSEQPALFNASMPEDYKGQRAKLLTEKAAAMKKLMDGELEPEAYAAEDTRISDALDDLTAQRIRAETLQQANVQTQAAYQTREINKLIARTKTEVDYAGDPTAPKQFDKAIALVMGDPENAGRDFAELADEAHRMVAAMRGVKTKTPAPPPAPAAKTPAAAPPARTPDGKPPVTLRDVPAASLPNTGGGVVEQMATLTGQAYEAAFAKLSPQQRRQLLDEV
jgi:hypothetical protein